MKHKSDRRIPIPGERPIQTPEVRRAEAEEAETVIPVHESAIPEDKLFAMAMEDNQTLIDEYEQQVAQLLALEARTAAQDFELDMMKKEIERLRAYQDQLEAGAHTPRQKSKKQ